MLPPAQSTLAMALAMSTLRRTRRLRDTRLFPKAISFRCRDYQRMFGCPKTRHPPEQLLHVPFVPPAKPCSRSAPMSCTAAAHLPRQRAAIRRLVGSSCEADRPVRAIRARCPTRAAHRQACRARPAPRPAPVRRSRAGPLRARRIAGPSGLVALTFPSSSGSRAILTAIRRASSLVSACPSGCRYAIVGHNGRATASSQR
jgi:hypothetical protein